MRSTTLIAVVAAFTLPLHSVSADPGRRDQLKNEITRLLSDLSSELRDVPSDSSTSDLERTIEYARNVADKSKDLQGHVDGDSEAQRMSSTYPDIGKRYQDAAKALREMKLEHRRLDDRPRKCEDANRELASRLRAFTDAHDPRGIDEVPKLARDFGKIGREAVEQAEGLKKKAYESNDRVDDFSDSDGKWSDVKSNLISAGRVIYDDAVRIHDQIKRDDVCANLAKEERNPMVEQAMQKLFEGRQGIQLIYTSLDKNLAEIASNLDGLVGDTNDSDIQTAERNLGEIDRLLDQLDRIKGNDAEAKRRLELYRNISRQTVDALRSLRVLKQAQFLADKAPDKCRESADSLRATIRTFLDSRRTEGINEIPLRARALAEPIKQGLTRTDEQHVLMERAHSDALRFDSSEGRWRDVRDRHRTAATAIFGYWTSAREAAHKACDELAKGEQNAEVVRAVADLSRARTDGETALLRLEADHRRWYDGLKELRVWYKEDTQSVRDMFCNIDESVGDSAEGDAYAARLAQIANRMRDRIAPRWNQLSTDAFELQARAQGLMTQNDDAVRRGGTRVREAITATMQSVQNVLANELNGANDPEIRARIEFGKNEHKRIQSDKSKCVASELPFGNRRVDCIRVEPPSKEEETGTCFVIEIKPNNTSAITRGRSQAIAGLREIESAMVGYLDKTKKKRTQLTGVFELFRPCFDEGAQQLKLKEEVRAYDFCPPDGSLFRDFVVP